VEWPKGYSEPPLAFLWHKSAEVEQYEYLWFWLKNENMTMFYNSKLSETEIAFATASVMWVCQ